MSTPSVVRAAVLSLITLCASAHATTIYVATTGNDANDGLTWATAKKTVQAGTNAARSGDQVWVAAGTYVGTVFLPSGIALYGGFSGTETDSSQRNWATNVTVLDGNNAGSAIIASAGTRIDGFTIRNGKNVGSNGGGIQCLTTVTITNNTIVGNSAGFSGGGISCSGGSPTITNNIITGNSAAGSNATGGGIYCWQSAATITNNIITGNNASSYGGGVYCQWSSATIADNTFSGNTASSGGAIYCLSSSPGISNNKISGNTGNAIVCTTSSQPMIACNVIAGNTGSGILNSSSSPTIVSNMITGNSTSGVYCVSSSSPTVINDTIAGNGGPTGGGVYCSASSPVIVNTIIAFNSSGIYGINAVPSLRSSCVYGNAVYNYSGLNDPTGTAGNISSDPGFANPSYGDFDIQPSSPCTDTGDDTVVQSGWVDVDGQPRMQGSHVDMGADESDGTVRPSGAPVVVRVCPQGDDANDGSSWSMAKRTVQAGVDAASATGGDVWVAAGTYVERITLRNYAHVYGGFGGAETERDSRDPVAHVTILDGNKGGNTVTATGIGYGLSTIDGFTIRNGNGTGGIYCSYASPSITNNMISGNSGTGAGICCSSSSPTITHNTITANSCGGIYCNDSSPVIVANTITNNLGYADGAGIACLTSSPVISNNAIGGNSTGSPGGGICCKYSCWATITNNTIWGNSASVGGGIACYSAASPLIANNVILGNGATGTNNYGGGIYCFSSSPTMVNNTIIGNNASGGGGIYCSSGSPIIANTIVAFNTNGIYSTDAAPLLQSNCVYGNTTYNYSGTGDPTGINGNISADPKIVDLSFRNGHIQPDSPCIDAGNDSLIQSNWTDIDGQARILGNHVDIGADESDGTIWPVGPGAIIHVAPEGYDGNDGLSWTSPKRTVQTGIIAAARAGGEVWVKAGTYPETITLSAYSAVYGGFAGTETQRGARDWRHNVTILDANQSDHVVTVSSIAGEPCTIDGFTIRNGKGNPGAGIYCNSGSPTIANNTVTGSSGAGIYCDATSPTITNNTIIGSSAAGIYCKNGSPQITNNTITGSNASGIYCYTASPTIANNVIVGNAATQGGAIYLSSSSSPIVAGNTITGNSATDGGGIYCYGSYPTITNTIIAFNSSGICNTGSTPSIAFSCVYGNNTYNYSGMADPTGRNGNISVDPKLAWPSYVDVHLGPDSPCIDAGDDSAIQPAQFDMDGQPRKQGAHTDIGADESDGTMWPSGGRTTMYVSPLGNDASNGSSWSLAKRTVQAAISAAAPSGGQVWVAAGTYVENIALPLDVAVYGGFAGTESGLSERDRTVNQTILDGNSAGSVVTFSRGVTRSTRIDGFTIRNGTGGVNCLDASPTIANNTISGNTISSNGGGIWCYGASSPMVITNAISGNTAALGAGIYCSSSLPATITGNIIAGNSGSNAGGGIYCISSSPIIADNWIAGNTVSSNGGGIYCTGGSPLIVGNTITGNAGFVGGGGVYCASSAIITNTIVAFNSSGIHRASGTPTLRYNCVYGNTTYNFSGMTDPSGTNGNFCIDPLFVQTPGPGPDNQWGTADDILGDVHLQADSPCTDAGDPAYVPTAGETDMDGQARILNRRVDIGADESNGISAPVFLTASPLPNGIVGAVYSQTLAATGGKTPYTWSIAAGDLPPGLSLDAATGVINGTPSGAAVASFTVEVAGTDGLSSMKDFSLSVYNAPMIATSGPLPDGKMGVSYNETLTATGGATPYTWSISAGSLPPGLYLGTNGLISGTPSAGTTATFTVMVTGNDGAFSTKDFTLATTPAPTITTTSPLPAGTVGEVYNQTFTATGGTVPYTWSLYSGSLPSGMTLSSDGILSGTCNTATSTSIYVKVTGADGASSSQYFALTIAAVPTITTVSPLPNGMVGTAYSRTLAVSGGATPCTWTITAGSLPPGLGLSTAGLISGTPTTDTTASFTVQVTDNNGVSATKDFSLTIAVAWPTITTASLLPGGTAAQAYSQTLAATGGTTPYTWSISAGNLPSGLSLSTGGVISGTPEYGTVATFTVQVTGGNSASSTKDFTLMIAGIPATITTTTLPGGTICAAYSQTLTATNGHTPYTWSIIAGALPPGLALSTDGIIGGTPTTATVARFTVQLTTSDGVSTTKGFTLAIALPYAWTNFAGLPGGQGSDDGTGPAARFNEPSGVAVDSVGNTYIADSGNGTIRKVTPAGVVTTLAGSPGSYGNTDGMGSEARFGRPQGLAVDRDGNLYVTDMVNHNLRKVTPAGAVTTLVGSGGTGSTGALYYPWGVAVANTGVIYVANSGINKICKVASDGTVTTLAGSGGRSGMDGPGDFATFASPAGVAVDGAGNVYVADTGNHTIRRVTPDGTVTTLAGSVGSPGSIDGTGNMAKFNYPSGVAIGTDGDLYVADANNNTIRKVTLAGAVTTLAGLAGTPASADGTAGSARFSNPSAVAVDSTGNLHVVDQGNDTVRVVTPSGVVTTLAGQTGSSGSADGAAPAPRFSRPSAVALDSAGNAYVADTYNHTIRKVSPAGVVTTLAGTAGSSGSTDGIGNAARFNNPSGAAVDGAGNVYIADTKNHTIRKVTPAGVVTTLAGTAGSSGSTDGTGSAALFYNPSGVAVDTVGNVYVADMNNHTIRKITPLGTVTTLAGSARSAGGADGTGSTARFNHPVAVMVDVAGNVYVADRDNHTIRQVTPAGVVTTLAGAAGSSGSDDGIGGTARFNNPSGVAVDRSANIYVADAGNNTIRQITPAGAVTTIGGTARFIGGADGVGSAAGFYQPAGIAIDPAGNLYVADTSNNRISRGTCLYGPPPVPVSPMAADGQIDIPVGSTLFWSLAAPGRTFDVYLDTVNPPVTKVASGLSTASYTPSSLAPATRYYWKVVAINDVGQTEGPVWTFATHLANDIDGDGAVNLADLKLLVAAWNSYAGGAYGNWNPAADLDGDDYIGLADLKILVANWNKAL